MIFHICPPDIVFIKSLIDRFEQVKPGFNRWIIVVSKHHNIPRIEIDKTLIEYIGPVCSEIIRKINDSECQGIVVHTLNDDILDLSLYLINRYPVIWRSWGPDLHDLLYPDFNLLLPYTQKLVSGRDRIFQSSVNFLRPKYNQFSGRERKKKDRILKKLEFLIGIDFIVTVTRFEFNMLQKRVPDMKAKYLQLNYRSLDINKLQGFKSNSNLCRVMVGHSSYSYLNHADIFYQLNYESYNEELVVPLNYGDTVYRDKIILLGQKLFARKVSFLIDFLKFEDYFEYINRCSSFINNSKVQSGGGNIIYFLYQGSKVYLREENPVFLDFKEMGIKLFSIQKELSNKHLLQSDISLADKINNREIIENMFSTHREKENVINAYKAFNILT
jgi:dTDP-N-acetylfucosamine:lipid II N-acetylfucosaminyltransferase